MRRGRVQRGIRSLVHRCAIGLLIVGLLLRAVDVGERLAPETNGQPTVARVSAFALQHFASAISGESGEAFWSTPESECGFWATAPTDQGDLIGILPENSTVHIPTKPGQPIFIHRWQVAHLPNAPPGRYFSRAPPFPRLSSRQLDA